MSDEELALSAAVDALVAAAAAYAASITDTTVSQYELADYRVEFMGGQLRVLERK